MTVDSLFALSDGIRARRDAFLMQKWAMTGPRYEVLRELLEAGALNMGELSERSRCSRCNLTGIVDRMERDGWIERGRKERGEDRRQVTVVIAREREDEVRRIVSAVRAMETVWAETLASVEPALNQLAAQMGAA